MIDEDFRIECKLTISSDAGNYNLGINLWIPNIGFMANYYQLIPNKFYGI